MLYGNETAAPNVGASGFNTFNSAPRNRDNFNRVRRWTTASR